MAAALAAVTINAPAVPVIANVLGFWVVEGRVFYTSGSDPKKAQCWTFTEKDPAPVLLAESSGRRID